MTNRVTITLLLLPFLQQVMMWQSSLALRFLPGTFEYFSPCNESSQSKLVVMPFLKISWDFKPKKQPSQQTREKKNFENFSQYIRVVKNLHKRFDRQPCQIPLLSPIYNLIHARHLLQPSLWNFYNTNQDFQELSENITASQEYRTIIQGGNITLFAM